MAYHNDTTTHSRERSGAVSKREYEQRKRERMRQIESDPEVRRAYEEHRRRRMEQIMSDPAARREYERRKARRAHERRMRRIRTAVAAVLSAAAGVVAAFAVHAVFMG